MARRLFWIFGLILVLSYFGACAPSQEARKKESEAIRSIGEAYMIQGSYSQALGKLLEAEKIYADDHILQNYLGLAYLNNNKVDLAITHFERAVQLNPSYAPAYNLSLIHISEHTRPTT